MDVKADPAACNPDKWVEVPGHLRCRLLFGSPVCVLVTPNLGGAAATSPHPFNAMTISWLTAIDNHRRFFLSVNSGRHSLVNLLRDRVFTLSVAVQGMERALLSFGGLSGRVCSHDADSPCPSTHCKFALVLRGEPWVAPGSAVPWRPGVLPSHRDSPAHLVCRVNAVLGAVAEPASFAPESSESAASGKDSARDRPAPTRPPIQHTLLDCEIDAAFVRQSYWHLGKIFGAPREATSPRLPAPLAFAGTKKFATIALDSVSMDVSAPVIPEEPQSTAGVKRRGGESASAADPDG